jgi:hypothetical protein
MPCPAARVEAHAEYARKRGSVDVDADADEDQDGDTSMTPDREADLVGWFRKVEAEACGWLEELRREGQTPLIPGSAPSHLQEIQRLGSSIRSLAKNLDSRCQARTIVTAGMA